MTGLSWSVALDIVGKALRLDPPLMCAAPTRRVLRQALNGSGIDVIRSKIVSSQLVVSPDTRALLIEQETGLWMPVGVKDGRAFVLSETGAPMRGVNADDARMGRTCWFFSVKETSDSRLFSFMRRHKDRLGKIFLCGFLVNFFSLCLPLFSSFVYDKILGNGVTETLWALAISLLLIAVIEFAVRTIRVIAAEEFAIGSETDIDHSVFSKLLTAPSRALPSFGLFMDRYKQLLSARDFLSSTYLLSLVDVPFLILFLLAIAMAAGPLVFVPIVFGAMMIAVNFFTTLPAFDYDRRARGSSETRFRLLADFLSAHEGVRPGAMRDDLAHRWRNASGQACVDQSKARIWRALGMNVSNTLSFLSYIAVIVGGVYMVEERLLTSGGLLAASMLSSRAISSFVSVIHLIVRYREFKIAVRDLDHALPCHPSSWPERDSAPRQEKAQETCWAAPIERGDIFLDRVSFSHTSASESSSKPILSDISLHIPAGQIVGIAGRPGAGKTTLLRLIAHVLTPDDGSVQLDNVPVSRLSDQALAQTIGYKPQRLSLIQGSIEDVVRAGRTPLSHEDKKQLLALSGLGHAFHASGLNWTTDIGPMGDCLSGGQQQLVALARALYGVPSVLLLDEPTNGLDQEMEAYIAKQLLTLRTQRTVLVSTHSPALLGICDRIIVTGQSRILADGPRDKILVNAR